jgi:Tfp pilus assembly protein PilF
VVEVDGIEAARKSVSDLNSGGLREDFEIYHPSSQQAAAPGVISAKFNRPQNPKTADLYKKAAEAERDNLPDETLAIVKGIVTVDPEDFIAWAKLGSLYLQSNSLAESENAFRKCIKLQRDYTPALLNIGMVLAVQNRYPEAIKMFESAVVSDPQKARAYRLLGEAYLQNRQGSVGLVALDEALRLDPIGMAECHLLKARLYDLAGAKNLASHEYKVFLKKVTDHPDRAKFEKYIKDNPE